MKRPPATNGLRHIALRVNNIDACVQFYTEVIGMTIEWQPDDSNVYLTTGHDNLALHKAEARIDNAINEHLDHTGFILNKIEDVDQWYDFMRSRQVPIVKSPKTHRDGARSFYCKDPDGNVVQMIYHPPLAKS